LYVLDLAMRLLARGHLPICYSPELGEVADELQRATIPVVDNLDDVGASPDVIHGHHHLESMTALARFPGVPAVYVCHGWSPWPEVPPRFPRILRYAAVSEAIRDKLIYQHGIPQGLVTVLLSFVDLDRFPPRGPLPDRPARALVFSNAASEGTYLPAVREACVRAGISLDVIGTASGNPCPDPGRVLGRYDVVFAKGRAALEAAAVGCAVILCDEAGAGPLVTASSVEDVRALNFGQRLLREPIEAGSLHRELLRFDADDARDVSCRVRATAGPDTAVDAFVGLYREVIDEHAQAGLDDSEAEGRALAAYLRWLSPRAKGTEAAVLALETAAKEAREMESREKTLEAAYLELQGTATFRLRAKLLAIPWFARSVRWLGRTAGEGRKRPAGESRGTT
jgi:hypothetical protein